MTREQLDAIRARLDGGYELSRLDMALLLAEVERLRAELDTVGEVLAATSLKCDYAFKRGVAAMREAAASHFSVVAPYDYIAPRIRALPDPEDR